MKNKTFLRILLLVIVTAFLSSCNELFKDDSPPDDIHLVSYELARSYTPAQFETIIGFIVDEYPDIAEIQDEFQYGVMVYKMEYNTTFYGEEKIASGLVCIPIGEGPFPVMSYQNGTNTLHAEAPSVNPDRDLYRLLQFAASTGFVIAIPDYLGFGSTANMFHPYLDEETTVQTVLDMLRAVDEMITNYDLNANITDELYITGYSQGGWATMHVQKEIEQNYRDEFNLMASSCAAGPYDLNAVNDYIMNQTTYQMPYYLGYMYNSYIHLNLITFSADEIFQEPYASKMDTLFNGSLTGEEINDELTTDISDLFTAEYLSGYKTDEQYSTITTSLEENSVEAWNISTPTLLIHGTEDEFIPLQVSINMYQDFLAEGVSENEITLLPLEGEGHISGIIPAGLASVKWFLEIQQQN